MRLRHKHLVTAILVLALAACEETEPTDSFTGNQTGDETPDDDGDDETAESDDDEGADAGKPPRRDAGRDAANAFDAGDSEEDRDGGRDSDGGTRDGGKSDAGVPSADDGAVPAGDVCAPTASWDPAWAAFEDEVLRLTNEARAAGHNCDSKGNFGKASPLAMESRLRCAARLYSKQLAESGTFSHTGPDGSSVDSRIKAAGYTRWSTWAENIAKGQQTPAEVVAGWLESDGHCANIMSPSFTQIGVGYFPLANPKGRPTTLWTQNFAKPR